jgi:HK97 family phage portal protein
MADKVFRDHLRDAVHWFTAPGGEAKQGVPLETKASAAMQAQYAINAGIPQYAPRKYRDLLKTYISNPIVRRATKLCGEAVASIEPIVKVANDEENSAAQALKKWFARPNPGEDGFSFRSSLASYFKLSGNGWVEGVRGMTSGYFEAYALRPERMQIEPGKTGWPQAYIYDSGTGRKVRWAQNFEAEQSRLLHIKDFNPADDFFGAGALEAAEGALALYDNAQNLARAMFEKGLITPGILSYRPQVPAGQSPPSLTTEQRQGLQKLLDEFKKGGKRQGQVMIADASLEFVPMMTTMVDLQAEEIRNQAKRDIALAFGVPPMMLGIPGDNTYSNYQEAGRAFYRNTVIPDTTRIFAAMSRWLSALTGIPGLTIEFDEDDLWALSEELNLKTQRILGNDTLSAEEQREALGWDPVPAIGTPRFMQDMMQMLAQDLARAEPKRVGSSKEKD